MDDPDSGRVDAARRRPRLRRGPRSTAPSGSSARRPVSRRASTASRGSVSEVFEPEVTSSGRPHPLRGHRLPRDDQRRDAARRARRLDRPRRVDPVCATRRPARRRPRGLGARPDGPLSVRSSIGVDVDAPPDLVYRIARDVTRWERLLPHYARSRVVRREADGSLVCDFVARRVVPPLAGVRIPVAWRSRTWHEPATRRLHFHHVAGATRGMDVTWTIESAATGDEVEIEHDFRPRVAPRSPLRRSGFTRPSRAGRWRR